MVKILSVICWLSLLIGAFCLVWRNWASASWQFRFSDARCNEPESVPEMNGELGVYTGPDVFVNNEIASFLTKKDPLWYRLVYVHERGGFYRLTIVATTKSEARAMLEDVKRKVHSSVEEEFSNCCFRLENDARMEVERRGLEGDAAERLLSKYREEIERRRIVITTLDNDEEFSGE